MTHNLKSEVIVKIISSGFYQIFFKDGQLFSHKLFGYHSQASRYLTKYYSTQVVEVRE